MPLQENNQQGVSVMWLDAKRRRSPCASWNILLLVHQHRHGAAETYSTSSDSPAFGSDVEKQNHLSPKAKEKAYHFELFLQMRAGRQAGHGTHSKNHFSFDFSLLVY